MADEFDYSDEAQERDVQTSLDDLAAARMRDNQIRFETKAAPAATPDAGGEGAAAAAGAAAGQATAGVAQAADAVEQSPLGSMVRAVSGTVEWVKKLPQNIGLGLMDAAVNTASLPFDAADSMGDALKHSSREKRASGEFDILGDNRTAGEIRNQEPHWANLDAYQTRLAKEILTARDEEALGEHPVSKAIHELPQQVSAAYSQWRSEIADESSMADQITQGTAQFMVPFTAFSKAFGVSSKLGFISNTLRLGAAEAATASTVLAADSGRGADLIDLGLHAENKFGDLMRTAMPDGSLTNQYIEWMTDRDEEGAMAGRFKNTVDSLGLSAAMGSIFKLAGLTFKAAKGVPAAVREPSVRPGSLKSQRGAVGDLSKVEPKAVISKDPVKRRLDQLLDNWATRMAREDHGQAILDDMAERGEAPRAVGAEFWTNTYPKLNEVTARKFERYAKSLGFEPGDVLSIDKDGNKQIANSWAEVGKFLSEDLGQNAEHLEGTERGFVSMMKYANDQAAVHAPLPAIPSGVKALKGGFEEQHTGLVFQKDTDAASAAEELSHHFGHGFEERLTAGRNAASDKNYGTLHSFAQVLKANADKPVSTHSLVSALERNLKGDTESGAFYKELLGRLKRKNLGGMTTVKIGKVVKNGKSGEYFPGNNAIQLYEGAFTDPNRLLHVFTHEAVHKATVREMRESPKVYAQLKRLQTRLKDAHAGAEGSFDPKVQAEAKAAREQALQKKPDDLYGFTNPEEFVAEIESNPEFRKLMKETKIDGESAWDKYIKTIAGILGIAGLAANPEFDKLMDPKQEKGEETGA